MGNKTEMPLITNDLISSSSLPSDYTYKPLTSENVDGCYFLMNESTKKRNFVYKNANDKRYNNRRQAVFVDIPYP